MFTYIKKISLPYRLVKQHWLIIAAFLLLSGFLGSHTIWTQEYRWQHICQQMLANHDYFHPYLDGHPYYDKPLVSYWLMIGFSKLLGGLSNWALRWPSVIAGFITLACTYWLGKRLFDRETGHLATWLLLTTFFFVFWARVASTDMMNVMSVMLGCCWFIAYYQDARFWPRMVFFLILAIGALLKGLIAPVLVALLVLPFCLEKSFWQRHLDRRTLIAIAIAAIVYLTPFLLSSFINDKQYSENGLIEVFRENILRFVQPFDHQGGPLTYFVFMPAYTLPWTPLVIIALIYQLCTFKRCNTQERWALWSVLSIFIFLSLSGSRRSYYILPIIPFTMIMTAAWWQKLFADKSDTLRKIYFQRALKSAIIGAYILLFVYFVLLQPFYYTVFKHHA